MRPLRPVSPKARLGERVHGDVRGERASAWTAVHAVVRRIPRGRVMTYGQIANLLEERLSPVAVGWALHASPAGLPWQRVVNAAGGCSTDRLHDLPGGMQRALLEAEGVEFGADGTLDLARYRWVPARRPVRSRRSASASRRGA